MSYTSPFLFAFRLLCSVQGTALITVVNTCAVERTADNVVTNTRQILNTSASDHDNTVFLQVMTYTGNICCHFHTVGQTNTGVLTKSRVRLLRCHRAYTCADASLLRAAQFRRPLLQRVEPTVQRRRLGLVNLVGTAFAYQLMYCWHYFSFHMHT